VEHFAASFGWDRVVGGGYWPVCTRTSTLQQWAQASDQLFSGTSEAQRENVYYKYAERIYRI